MVVAAVTALAASLTHLADFISGSTDEIDTALGLVVFTVPGVVIGGQLGPQISKRVKEVPLIHALGWAVRGGWCDHPSPRRSSEPAVPSPHRHDGSRSDILGARPMSDATPQPPPPTEQPARRTGISVTVAVGLILLVLFAIFAIQNREPVTVEFLAWTFETSRIVLLLVTAAVFVILDQIGGYLWRRRRRQRKVARALRKGA